MLHVGCLVERLNYVNMTRVQLELDYIQYQIKHDARLSRDLHGHERTYATNGYAVELNLNINARIFYLPVLNIFWM